MATSKVLQDVAKATRERRGHERPEVQGEIVRCPLGAPTLEAFLREARAASARVDVVARKDVKKHLEQLVVDVAPEKILLEDRVRTHFSGLENLGIVGPVDRDQLFAADVGVVMADGGIAETGSLIFCSQPGASRGFSLAPMKLITFLDEQELVEDLYDWLSSRDPLVMPSNMLLLTGPSKTADIEMKLVTGVHGPGEVHILLVSNDDLL